MLTLCLLILLYSILKKPIDDLVAQLKDANWDSSLKNAWNKIVAFSKKAGREATRVVLRLYYVLAEGDLSAKDKALAYAGIIYIVVPHDLLPRRVLGLLGMVDDAAVIAWLYNKVKDHITPEIDRKVDSTLDGWFGTDPSIS